LATTPADRAQALGQGKLFEARALTYFGAVREHQRSFAQLLGVAPGREIFVRVPDAEGSEARRRLWALTPEEVPALPRSLRQPLTDWDATVARMPWAQAVPRLAEWNQRLIELYEADYQKWAEDYDLLRERQIALQATQEAYAEQALLRRLEYTQRKATIGEWLESQRFHLEAEASLKMVQKDRLLKLLCRQDALRG
jgi:hypothetical protein